MTVLTRELDIEITPLSGSNDFFAAKGDHLRPRDPVENQVIQFQGSFPSVQRSVEDPQESSSSHVHGKLNNVLLATKGVGDRRAGNVFHSEADVAMARRNKGYEHWLPSKKGLR